MADRNIHLKYIKNAAKHFLEGQLSLEKTISTVESVLSILEDAELSHDLFEAVSDLESVNAEIHQGGFDFETNGRDIVERAANSIVTRVEQHLNTKNPQTEPE